MNEGYLRPEQLLLGAVTSVLLGLLMSTATRSSETKGRYTMVHCDGSIEAREIIGHSLDEFPAALALMEASIEVGQKARIQICTEALPADEVLENLFLGMTAAGCHASRPAARLIEGIPATEFVLQKGSPSWVLIIPLIVPLATIGLITFGIVKIETIARALLPLIGLTVGGLIVLAVVLRAPAIKYIEREKALPLTSKHGVVSKV